MSIWVDGAVDYLAACKLAATDDEAFANFKRDPVLTEVWEHVPVDFGKAYLYVTRGLDIEADFRPALVNDKFGNPLTFELTDDYHISPTTCRYVWTYYMLRKLFGHMPRCHMAEIGGGYGGQAVVLRQYGFWTGYDLFDLPEPLSLQRRYLRECGVTRAGFYDSSPTSSAAWPGPYFADLVISTFALSELTAEQQDEYADTIIRHAPRGFLVCNDGNTQATLNLINKLGKKNAKAHYEPVYTDSYMVWWGAK